MPTLETSVEADLIAALASLHTAKLALADAAEAVRLAELAVKKAGSVLAAPAKAVL